jgi:hypothetical protein
VVNNDLISRSALLEQWKKKLSKMSKSNDGAAPIDFRVVVDALENAPAVDAVSCPMFEQIKWERDCAMQQLKDHGIPFGGNAPDVVKVVRCCECIYRDGTPGQPNIMCYQMHDDDFCSYGERRSDDGK